MKKYRLLKNMSWGTAGMVFKEMGGFYFFQTSDGVEIRIPKIGVEDLPHWFEEIVEEEAKPKLVGMTLQKFIKIFHEEDDDVPEEIRKFDISSTSSRWARMEEMRQCINYLLRQFNKK